MKSRGDTDIARDSSTCVHASKIIFVINFQLRGIICRVILQLWSQAEQLVPKSGRWRCWNICKLVIVAITSNNVRARLEIRS